MDNRQTHRLAELVAAADIAIASAAAEPTESATQRPQPAFETSYRVVEQERFMPRDVREVASTVRSTLLDKRGVGRLPRDVESACRTRLSGEPGSNASRAARRRENATVLGTCGFAGSVASS